MTRPLRTQLSTLFDEGEWHAVDHPPSLCRGSIVPPLRQSRKAGWGWAGERLAASGEPQVGVWGGPEKRGAGLAKSEPGRRTLGRRG